MNHNLLNCKDQQFYQAICMGALFEDAAGHDSLSIQLMYDEYESDELF